MVGIVVIGAGRWGNHLIRNVLEHPDAELVAVVDRDPERLAAVADKYQLDGRVILTTGWASVKPLPQVQAAIVATPATDHYETISQILDRGCHVLAEKPLTLDPQEAIALCRLAESKNLILSVDHTYLFNPAVERGAEVVNSGALGQLRYGYAARTHLGPVRRDVDVLWDLVIHDIAIFNRWLGESPTQVSATGEVWLQPTAEAAPRDLFPEGLADVAWATLTYPSGFRAQIHLCWCNPDKQRRLAVTGSQGTLVFDELSPSPLTLYRGHLDRTEAGDWNPSAVEPEAIATPAAEPLRRVFEGFLESVRSQQPCDRSSGWVGVELVKVLRGLTESSSQGGVPVSIE
ncbi:oxidoreductase Gfo/Idh/MocA family/transferase hexapeptide repeat protein [Geitlerinema sp. FC II]|nr:oxidoreductase Gfo/Idh/MocA family/transferase hexapeptide repeat protein [Geitlerinema sp. FC II]